MPTMRGNPFVRLRLVVATALIAAGSGGIVPTLGVGTEVAYCEEPVSRANLFSPGERDASWLPPTPLDLELGGAVDPATSATASTLAPTSIPTWFHIITAGPGTDVDDERIARQLSVLNAAFTGSVSSPPTPFSFVHAGTDRTENPAWHGTEFGGGSDAEREAKTALHQGGANTLNVYVTETETGASWGAFPWWYRTAPALDGIVLDLDHFVGALPVLSEGDIAVHEVGHWLGLWHTFQGGCDGEGDFVADTPAHQERDLTPDELEAVDLLTEEHLGETDVDECHTPQDTCPLPGNDPQHNFMNYVMELCTDRFTVGQVDRMKGMWTKYRAATGGSKPGRGGTRK